MDEQPINNSVASQENINLDKLTMVGVLKTSWQIFTNNLGAYLGIYFLSIAIYIIMGIIVVGLLISAGTLSLSENELTATSPGNIAILIITFLASIIVISFVSARIYASQIAMTLKIVRENRSKISFKEAWQLGAGHTLKLFWLSLAVGLMIVFGLVLLIAPGLYFIAKYSLSFNSSVDKSQGVQASTKHSAEISKGKRWFILGFFMVMFLVSIITSVVPILGDIAGIVIGIISVIGTTVIYLHLTEGGAPEAKAESVIPSSENLPPVTQ